MKPVKRYRMVRAPGHPVASKTGLTLLHRKVLFDKIGPGEHHCHWCGELVQWIAGRIRKGALIVDHLDHDKDNNSPDNLVPSCNACNAHRLSGETWDAWIPGSPIGRPDRNHKSCPRGHLLVPENVYIRPDTGRRQCRTCIRLRSRGASHTAGLAERAGIETRRFTA
jgi:hypothetical protein